MRNSNGSPQGATSPLGSIRALVVVVVVAAARPHQHENELVLICYCLSSIRKLLLGKSH